jgi:hypothetical protein
MRLGREQAAGYVEDIEADEVAPAELAADAPALAPLTPVATLTSLDPPATHPHPAVIAG